MSPLHSHPEGEFGGAPGRDPELRSLETLGHLSYLLHAVVAVGTVMPGLEVSVLLLVAAFFIDLLKRGEATGTWQASHFRWRLRTVLWAGGLYVVTAPLFLLFYLPGKLAWFAISLWFVYRILRGWMNLDAGRPVGPPPAAS
jgi:uncharacterized membrane protein